MNLTPKQLQILTLIRDIRLTRGYSPTIQELADALGVSKVTVFERVESLIEKGALLRRPNRARSLEVNPEVELPDEQRHTRLPLVGTIAAGSPIEAMEDREYLDLEQLFSPPGAAGNTFVLRVKGDSMIEEHIREGDYVVVERRNTALNGQTVVALLGDGHATLKKYYRERDRVRLQPANEKYEPMYAKHGEVQVQGVVIGVVRSY